LNILSRVANLQKCRKDVLVSKLHALTLAGVAGVALATAAVAASPRTHVMNVPLPDGSVERIEYSGNVQPKVTFEPAAAMPDAVEPFALPSFAGFDRMIEKMNRQTQAMMRQAQEIARQSGAAPGTPYVASYGNGPAGVTSTTVVSFSNGGRTCTRTTESVSQGPGKPPKVTSKVNGDCSSAPAPAPSGPINRT
jgi:hypothetical protein